MYKGLGSFVAAGLLLLGTPAFAAEVNTRDITGAQEIGERTKSFEHDLLGFGLPASLKCSMLVEVLSDGGGQDQSFGGICDMQLHKKAATTIMLCNDTMVGRLTIKAYGFGEDKSELADFTSANCPAGG